MKVTVQEIPGTEPELIIRCPDAGDPQVRALLELARSGGQRIPARQDGELLFLPPRQVLYCEVVDRCVYAYTADSVLPTSLPLSRLEQEFPGFLRCSRNMVVNLHAVSRLRSHVGGRILATLSNGEQILISRHYAAALRAALSIGKGN